MLKHISSIKPKNSNSKHHTRVAVLLNVLWSGFTDRKKMSSVPNIVCSIRSNYV